jgi:hypothetical protein
VTLSASPRHVVAVTALGTQVHVEVSGGHADTVAAELLRAWSRCDARRVDDAQGRSVRVLVDDDPASIEDAAAHGAIAGPTASVVGDQVALAVTLQAIEANEGDRLMLRAAAVADPETGRCVVLVGPAGSGRSTAARTLGRHFGYVTDDTVAFTPTLDLVPYRKPLAAGEAEEGLQSPDDLGLREAPEALRPAAVLLLERHAEGFVPPVLTELPTAEAVAHLSGNASYLRSLDKPLHRLAALVEEVGAVHRVDYREADDLVAVTQQLLNHPVTADTGEPSEAEPTLTELLGRETAGDGPSVRRADFVDFHVSNDGVGTVMLGETVVALSFLATRIVTLLGGGSATLDELAEGLLVEFGEPESGDARSLVETHVDDLVEAGVLTRG